MKRLYLATAFLLLGPAAHAGTLAVYDFTGQPGDEASVAATALTPDATFDPIKRGGSITSNAGDDSINSKGWTAGDGYYTFTVTPTAGSSLDLSTLEYTDRRSGTGPTTFVVAFSTDGFTTSTTVGSYSLSDTDNHREMLGLSALTGLTTAVEFRIFATGATGSTGTYRLGIDASSAGSGLPANLEILGPTAAVPEPPGAILLVLGLAGVVVLGRARVV